MFTLDLNSSSKKKTRINSNKEKQTSTGLEPLTPGVKFHRLDHSAIRAQSHTMSYEFYTLYNNVYSLKNKLPYSTQTLFS